MGESIWKKEISLGRKPRATDPAVDAAAAESAPTQPTSIWKKEIGLGRKPRQDAAPEQKGTSLWKKEIHLGRKPKAAVEPAPPVPAPLPVATLPVAPLPAASLPAASLPVAPLPAASLPGAPVTELPAPAHLAPVLGALASQLPQAADPAAATAAMEAFVKALMTNSPVPTDPPPLAPVVELPPAAPAPVVPIAPVLPAADIPTAAFPIAPAPDPVVPVVGETPAPVQPEPVAAAPMPEPVAVEPQPLPEPDLLPEQESAPAVQQEPVADVVELWPAESEAMRFRADIDDALMPRSLSVEEQLAFMEEPTEWSQPAEVPALLLPTEPPAPAEVIPFVPEPIAPASLVPESLAVEPPAFEPQAFDVPVPVVDLAPSFVPAPVEPVAPAPELPTPAVELLPPVVEAPPAPLPEEPQLPPAAAFPAAPVVEPAPLLEPLSAVSVEAVPVEAAPVVPVPLPEPVSVFEPEPPALVFPPAIPRHESAPAAPPFPVPGAAATTTATPAPLEFPPALPQTAPAPDPAPVAEPAAAKNEKRARGKKAAKPAAETTEKPVPFWKKEVKLGGRKGSQAATAAGPAPAAPAAAAATAAAKPVPFWKKEVNLGRKKASAAAAPAAQAAPPAEKTKKAKPAKPAKPAKSSEPKKPLLKRELSLSLPKLELGSLRAGKTATASSTPTRLVGLRIGSSQLAAALVDNNGSAQVLRLARVPLASGVVAGGEVQNPAMLASALKSFFADNKLPRRGVRIGVAANRIGVRVIEVPLASDPKAAANAIRFRSQEVLPFPLAEAVLDHHDVGEGSDGTRRILIAFAHRALIDEYVAVFKRAGIKLAGIDFEAFALLRAIAGSVESGSEADPTAALVAVAIGHERTIFAVSDGEVCEFTRVLDWGGASVDEALATALDVDLEKASQLKRELSIDSDAPHPELSPVQIEVGKGAIRDSLQLLARELVASLQFYQSRPGSLDIGDVLVTGGGGGLQGLDAELTRLIGVPVRTADPFGAAALAPGVDVPGEPGSLAIAVGLALEEKH